MHHRGLSLYQNKASRMFSTEGLCVSPVQFPTRPSKAELQRAALEQQPEPSTSDTPENKGPDIIVVWALPDAAGNPRCIGAHHVYDLQEKVNQFPIELCFVCFCSGHPLALSDPQHLDMQFEVRTRSRSLFIVSHCC